MSDQSIISIFGNIGQVTGGNVIAIDLFLDGIADGKWQDLVFPIRTIKDHEARQEAKKKLPYVTISGVFSERRAVSGLSAHSGFISMDIDKLGDELEGTRRLLQADPYIYALFTSVSGTGLCALFRIDAEKHREAFDGIADYLIKQYQIVVDPSGKDVSRPRYVSFDPALYRNPDAIRFKKYLPKPKKRQAPAVVFVQTEFDEIIRRMVDARVSCVEDYRDWLTVGFGLADQFGEAGRPYFHALSGCSEKYEASMCDRQYTHCMRHHGSERKVTIATIYFFAKQAGISLLSERTKKIAAATTQLKKSGLNEQAVRENLAKFEGITDADDIIKQAFNSATDFKTEENLIENIRMWLRHNYSLRRNEITRKIEHQGKPWDEIAINTAYLECKIQFEETTFDLFTKILFSHTIPQFNPLHEWFEERKDLPRPKGVIDAYFGCFKTPDDIKYFGKKWLVGCISSAYGIHSPLVLIYAGERQGTGKTEAWRRILPPELRWAYAESKLDAGKDDEILMTQKWIIVDDESGGKSKREAKRLKELTSKQVFTLREPYGSMNVDLTRLANLGATSNDLELLNDTTGNRRQLPMEIEDIDRVALNAISKQALFMEAWHLYQEGFDWQVSAEDARRLAERTEKFEEVFAEYELLEKYFEAGDYFLTATLIKNRLETLSVQKLHLKRLGMILKKLYPRVKRGGVYGYMVQEKDTLKPPPPIISGNEDNPF